MLFRSDVSTTAANAANVGSQASNVADKVASVVKTGVTEGVAKPTGLLGRVSNFIEANPNQAGMIGQTIGGVAKGVLSSREDDDVLEYYRERDRLNREGFISAEINKNPQTPTIRGFKSMPRYKWNE